MSVKQKLVAELRQIAVVALYFGCWIAGLVLLKKLVLAEYQIGFTGFSVVFVGALILSKVVIVLEHVSLAGLLRTQPAWVDVVLRTLLYVFGVFVVLLLEKAFEARHEYDGFSAALLGVFQHADIFHVWANTICLSAALLSYNVLSVVRKHLGKGGLLRLLMMPMPQESDAS